MGKCEQYGGNFLFIYLILSFLHWVCFFVHFCCFCFSMFAASRAIAQLSVDSWYVFFGVDVRFHELNGPHNCIHFNELPEGVGLYTASVHQ